VAKPDGDHETFINVASLDDEGFDLRADWPSQKKTATRRMLWDDMARAPCFALNMTGESAVRGPGLTWLFLSRTLLAELKAAGEVQFGLANEKLPDSNRFVTYMGTLHNVGSDTLALVLDDSLVHVPVIAARAGLMTTVVPGYEVTLSDMSGGDSPLAVSQARALIEKALARLD
jgi:hypothetical protein